MTYGDYLVRASVRPAAEDGLVELVPVATPWSRPGTPSGPAPVQASSDASSAEDVDVLEGHTYLALMTLWRPGGGVAEWGLHETDVERVLESTPPDPLAAPYADLDPAERYQRVAADRE